MLCRTGILIVKTNSYISVYHKTNVAAVKQNTPATDRLKTIVKLILKKSEQIYPETTTVYTCSDKKQIKKDKFFVVLG